MHAGVSCIHVRLLQTPVPVRRTVLFPCLFHAFSNASAPYYSPILRANSFLWLVPPTLRWGTDERPSCSICVVRQTSLLLCHRVILPLYASCQNMQRLDVPHLQGDGAILRLNCSQVKLISLSLSVRYGTESAWLTATPTIVDNNHKNLNILRSSILRNLSLTSGVKSCIS